MQTDSPKNLKPNSDGYKTTEKKEESPREKFLIVQCARKIGQGYGVSSPAYYLDRAFKQLGYKCEQFTLQDIGIREDTSDAGSRRKTIFRFWWNVVMFSLLGTVVIWWRYRWRRENDVIILCHVDALIGDLFVMRSLHKSYIDRNPKRWRLLIRNPLHLFVLARDNIRFRRGVHRRLIALSQSTVEEVNRLYGNHPNKMRIIPNGVDLMRFRPSALMRKEVRTELGWNDESVVLIFVANEFKRKGLDIILSALSILSRKDIDCRLIVAGSDSTMPFRAELARLADKVRIVGHRLDIERYYAAADLFVLPTAFDISPLAGQEALACGLPILMTKVGGVPYFLKDGENGLFIKRDPADVVDKIQILLEEGTLQKLAKQARASVEGFDWLVIASNYLKVMKDVIEERREECEKKLVRGEGSGQT